MEILGLNGKMPTVHFDIIEQKLSMLMYYNLGTWQAIDIAKKEKSYQVNVRQRQLYTFQVRIAFLCGVAEKIRERSPLSFIRKRTAIIRAGLFIASPDRAIGKFGVCYRNYLSINC